jgi:hypothetical protein
MLKKILTITITFFASILLSITEYNYFHINQKAAFLILNISALIFGLFLMCSTYLLLKTHAKYKLFLYINSIVGFIMTSIHIQKLIVGICI